MHILSISVVPHQSLKMSNKQLLSDKRCFILHSVALVDFQHPAEGTGRFYGGVNAISHFVLALAKLSCVTLEAVLQSDALHTDPLVQHRWVHLGCWGGVLSALLYDRWSARVSLFCTWRKVCTQISKAQIKKHADRMWEWEPEESDCFIQAKRKSGLGWNCNLIYLYDYHIFV